MKSDEVFLRHIDIEWTKIAGLRDKLIHGYFDVDLGILWDVIQKKLLPLRDLVEAFLKHEGTGSAE
ncbi:MAG: DUF86 domain-containing protein [Acidobacteria bacterium]|nr:DUF86 domain-containing protein [Acidobacteriota bacterium]